MNPSSLPGLAGLASEPIARRSLEPAHCALVVIDIQEKLLPAISNREELSTNARLLIRAAQILQIPALMSAQYPRGLGNNVQAITELLPGVPEIAKTHFGAFGSNEFCRMARQLPGHRTTMLLCGMESHICVMQTALGALQNGYMVHVASDAIGSRTEANRQVGIRRMEAAGAVISSTEMMIYELLQQSGTADFKAMLQHIK